jgi:hypothetical protein
MRRPSLSPTSYELDGLDTNSNTVIFFEMHMSQQLLLNVVITVFMSILFGLLLWKTREKSEYIDKIISFQLYKYLMVFVISYVCVVTNITTIFHMTNQSKSLLNESFLVICFLYNAILSLNTIVVPLLFRNFDVLNIGLFMEGSILHEEAHVFSLLCLFSLISGPLVLIFLPWKKSEFCIRSGGFPNLKLYRVVMYSEVCVSFVRFVAVLTSSERSSMSQISIWLSSIQFLLSAMHIFIKLRALSIQQYDVEIKLLDKIECSDTETNKNIEDSTEISVTVDIEKCEEELDICRHSIQEMRLSNRASMNKRDESILLTTVPIHLASKVEYPDENIEVLHNQLNALNSKPLKYIPLHQIRQRLQTLTDAINRGEAIDESEFDYLLQCMDVNKEYIQEEKEKERLWREQISTYAQECLMEQRRFIPPDIFVSTHTQLVHEKGIPVILAKRFMQKNVCG